MKILYCLLFLVPFVFGSDVLEFRDSNFEQYIREHSFILVEFYAPWCGHCKKLAPEYETAATALKKQDPPIPIAKVDCIAETKTCEKYGISGYPTLKIFKGGQFAFDYSGERSSDGIIKYMISKSGPSSRELVSEEAFDKFTSTLEPVVVGFFSKESSLHKTFMSIADKMTEDFRFAHTSNDDLLSKFNYKDDILIYYPPKMMSKFEESSVKYSGDDSEYKLKSWIEENVMGLVGLRTQSNMKYFSGKPLVVAFFNVDYEKNPKGSNYWRNRVVKIAKKYIDAGKSIYFAMSNSHEMHHELSEFGIQTPDSSKVYVVARDEHNKKHKLEEEFTMENFDKFLTDFLAGQTIAYLKSEAIPDKNDEPVKVIVAKNFDEIVNDPSKDVMIEFYAPWCGHCKSLAPKYEELAKKLSGEPDIVIAKMDATANDVPSPFEVSGFPTIYFVPKNSKKAPKTYNGGREVNDMINYIASEATSALKSYDRQGRVRKSEF